MILKHLGARSELIAATWLLDRGYEVFRNVSQHGAADLVAWNGTDTLFVDVKTVRPNRRGYIRKTLPSPKSVEIRFLFVLPDGTCELSPRVGLLG